MHLLLQLYMLLSIKYNILMQLQHYLSQIY